MATRAPQPQVANDYISKTAAVAHRVDAVEGDLVGTSDEQTLTNKAITAPGSTVDGTPIGGTTPATGSFTEMDATSVKQDGNVLLPSGTILPYAAASAPGGYLLCNGQAVSRTTYSALFAVLSTTYGSGDGSTTFNVPDLRNRMVYGGTSSLGTTGGSTTVNIEVSNMPAHTHSGTTDTDPGHTHSYNMLPLGGDYTPGNPDYSAGEYSAQGATAYTTGSGGAHSHDFTTGSTGGGESLNVMNPYMILNYIIKV